jgi:glycolate oxidase iron-sulfur subunit
VGNLLRPLLPGFIRRHVPVLLNKSYVLPAIVASAPRVLVLQGCVQKAATPQVNQALAVLLAQQGVAVEFLPEESCCGSLDYHLAAHDAARSRMRRLIDQLYPRLSEVQAVVSTASGCGVTLKEYTEIFADDPIYLAKAHQLHAKLRDVSELLASFTFSCLPGRVAFHSPCTLQHGQKINGVVEDILRRAGFALCAVQDAHLCCGSAGTYSLLQADISQTLLANKVTRLQAEQPDVIATANIGCQLHLQSGAAVPVVHWVELLADRLQAQPFKAVG